MSKDAHKGQILPLLNQMVPISKETRFHASYDNGLHGFNQGAKVEAIGPVRGIEFDGSSNSIFNLSFGQGWNPINENITIEMWVKASSLFTGRMVLGPTNGTNQRFYIGIGSGNWELGMQGRAWGGGTVPLTTDWVHIKMTAVNGTASLYVDGVLSDSETYTSFEVVSNFAIGGMHNGGYPWSGAIADVRITKNNELVAHYKMEEEEGLVLYDATANGHEAMRNGNVPIVPVSGPTIASFTKGKFGKAARIESATTNLVPEGIRTCSAPFSNEHGVATYSLERGPGGRKDVSRIKVSGSAGNNVYAYFGIANALTAQVDDVVMISFEYKIVEGPGIPTIDTVYADGFKIPDATSYGVFGPVTTEALEDGWIRSSRSVRITMAGNTYFRWNYFSQETEGEVLVDNFQIERRETATSFVDGSRGEGVLRYPIEVMNHDEGTLSFWMKHPAEMPYLNGGQEDAYVSTTAEYSSTSSLVMAKSGAYDSRILGIHWGGVNGSYLHCSDLLENVPAFKPKEWNMVTISWNKNVGYRYYINGVLIQDRKLNAGDTLMPFASKTLSFQAIAIDELRIEAKQVGHEEVAAWAASGLHYNYLDYSVRAD